MRARRRQAATGDRKRKQEPLPITERGVSPPAAEPTLTRHFQINRRGQRSAARDRALGHLPRSVVSRFDSDVAREVCRRRQDRDGLRGVRWPAKAILLERSVDFDVRGRTIFAAKSTPRGSAPMGRPSLRGGHEARSPSRATTQAAPESAPPPTCFIDRPDDRPASRGASSTGRSSTNPPPFFFFLTRHRGTRCRESVCASIAITRHSSITMGRRS